VYGYKGTVKTITVVDDDPNHRALIHDILSPLNFIVLEAASGEECLSLYEECQPDLYLMDISMPHQDGWEVAEALRNRGYKKPIIIASANANESSNNNLHPNIVNDHIIKPIKIDSLIEKIGQCLTIEWLHELPQDTPVKTAVLEHPNQLIGSDVSIDSCTFDTNTLAQLIELAEVGHLTELKKLINSLEKENSITPNIASQFRIWLQEVRFDKILAFLRHSEDV
jgi:CheY-like chemotaxis protein